MAVPQGLAVLATVEIAPRLCHLSVVLRHNVKSPGYFRGFFQNLALMVNPQAPPDQTAFFKASIRSVFSQLKPPSASGARPKWP